MGQNAQARDREQRKQLKDWLGQYGLNAEIMQLIDAAVRHDLSTSMIVQRLVHTETFHNQYPGLIHNGQIADFLTGRAGAPLTVQTLSSAVQNYQTLEKAYQDAAKNYGYKWKPNMMLNAIQNDLSPTEFTQRLGAIRTVNQTPGLRDFFEQAVKASGVHGVDTQKEVFRLAAGVSAKRFEDIYETARLAQANIGFSIQEGAKLAKQIGQPGEQVDIGALVSQVRQQLGDIGPELQSAGISNAQLTRFLANPKDDTFGLAPKLASIVAAKRARGQFVPGTQAQRGPAGGPALYQQEGAAAY